MKPWMLYISIHLPGNKKALQILDSQGFVPKRGIEPLLPKKHEFESCASTSSATLAYGDSKISVFEILNNRFLNYIR